MTVNCVSIEGNAGYRLLKNIQMGLAFTTDPASQDTYRRVVVGRKQLYKRAMLSARVKTLTATRRGYHRRGLEEVRGG